MTSQCWRTDVSATSFWRRVPAGIPPLLSAILKNGKQLHVLWFPARKKRILRVASLEWTHSCSFRCLKRQWMQRDRIRLSFAVPKIRWASFTHCPLQPQDYPHIYSFMRLVILWNLFRGYSLPVPVYPVLSRGVVLNWDLKEFLQSHRTHSKKKHRPNFRISATQISSVTLTISGDESQRY